MSHENVVKFLSRLVEDPELREKVQAFGDEIGTIDEVIKIASETGYSFTDQEVDDLFLAMEMSAATEKGQELTDEQLQSASGAMGRMGTRQLHQSFDLQFRQLQQAMANSGQFTQLSNIMKTKHDTAKSMINNVR